MTVKQVRTSEVRMSEVRSLQNDEMCERHSQTATEKYGKGVEILEVSSTYRGVFFLTMGGFF